MKKVVFAVAAFLALLAIGGIALATEMGGERVNKPAIYQLHALNASGENGTVTLIAASDKQTKVVITLTGEGAANAEPAHIHLGSCPNPGAVKWPLSNVIHGASTTLVNAPISQINKAGFAVNVHQSIVKINHYVACGNITP